MMTSSTLPAATDAPTQRSWLSILLWAVYLACSWTWCIGMFLPVLLVRDYSLSGFIVFALPNVLGAAAMGWILTSRASQSIVRQHALACQLFSFITIAFQLTFLSALLRDLSTSLMPDWTLAIALILLAIFSLSLPRLLALLIWIASAILLISAAQSSQPSPPLPVGLNPQGILFLAPVCIFGFALCPYLDLTFHRARQEQSASDSRLSFSIGFGVFFLAMILGTLSYSPLLLNALSLPSLPTSSLPIILISIHILIQLIYTVSVHTRELRRFPRHQLIPLTIFTAIAVVLLFQFAQHLHNPSHFSALPTWEVIYRLFMAFYGLIFPAYVWICIIPTSLSHASPNTLSNSLSRHRLITFFISISLASPFYWFGFIERHEIWLLPGLAIVLFARLFVLRSKSQPAMSAHPN